MELAIGRAILFALNVLWAIQVRANIQRALGKPLPLEEIGTMTVGGLKALAAQAQPQAPSKPAAAEQSAPASPAESPDATAGSRPDQPTATTSADPPKVSVLQILPPLIVAGSNFSVFTIWDGSSS